MSVDNNQIIQVNVNRNDYISDSEDVIEDLSSRQATASNNLFSLQFKQNIETRHNDKQMQTQRMLEVNRIIFEKLPIANELLPKKRGPIEQAQLVVKTPIINLPSFNGKAPQREELSRSKSEQYLQYNSTSKVKQDHIINMNSNIKYNNKQIQKGQTNQLSFQDTLLQYQQEGKKHQIKLKELNKAKNISLHQQVESSVEQIEHNNKNVQRGISSESKQTFQNVNNQNNASKIFDNETNLQKYFLRLNIVYKKYEEVNQNSLTPVSNKSAINENTNSIASPNNKNEEDVSGNQSKLKNKSSKDGLFLSNVVQFNTIYCDLRRLIKQQNETKQQHNLYSNISNSASQNINDKQAKGQSPLNGTNPSKRIGTNQDNIQNELSNDFSHKSIHVESNNQYLPSYYKKKNPNDKTLKFESRFESGNLSQAAKISDNEYDLLLQNDINTHGNTQWFFFKVSNTFKDLDIKFNILNFCKNDSLFNQGMKVLVYSKNLSIQQNKGWHRSCEKIQYYKNNFLRKQPQFQTTPVNLNETKNQSFQNRQFKQKTYFSLSFNYSFESNNDEVYFAYNYPYTYSELQEYLDEQENKKFEILNRRLLCRTLAGNRIDLLTITSRSNIYDKQGVYYQNSCIVLSARVHAGETVSSFVMKGIIDLLLSDTDEAQQLRDRFIFKIVPMLNPDGVIHGNYRCSLSGCDLNRRWKAPLKTLHPEIFYFKQMIYNFASSIKLSLFCDLHGHSMKKNIFIYGCHDNQQPLACRELPFLMSKLYEPFSFNDCNFLVHKSKEGTARVALWEGLRIPNIFTLESSFCGPSYDNIHFQQVDLEKMGKRMCQAFLIYFRPNKRKNKESGEVEDIEQINQKTQSNKNNSNTNYTVLSKTEQIYKRKQKNSNEQYTINDSDTNDQLLNSIPHDITPTKQLRSISVDENLTNHKHQKQLEDLRKHYLNELWTKNLDDIQKIGMNESDDSESCPSEDNLDEKEINRIFEKQPLQQPQKGITSRKNTQNNNRLIKKQTATNFNNSQSQSPSLLENQQKQQNQEDNSPFKQKEYGWKAYFGRGKNNSSQGIGAKNLSNSEDKTPQLQNSQEQISNINQVNRKNIQSSQIVLTAVKNKSFNFQCVAPYLQTNKQSPDHRYDENQSHSPKKNLYYQYLNSRQLPQLQKMNSSMIDNDDTMEQRRKQKYGKMYSKQDEQQVFIANTLSKQIKYLQPNQQQFAYFKQKNNMVQFPELFNLESQQTITDRNKNLRGTQNFQQQQSVTPPPSFNNQIINSTQTGRQSPFKRNGYKNGSNSMQKSNNKSMQLDQSFLGNQNISSVSQPENVQGRNNQSYIELRNEEEEGINQNIANQKMMLNQSMLPSLYIYDSSENNKQQSDIQQNYLNIDISDTNQNQRIDKINQIQSNSPKNISKSQNTQHKTPNTILSEVQSQIKKKQQNEVVSYIHQEYKTISQNKQQIQEKTNEESFKSSQYNDKIKNSQLNQPFYVQQQLSNQSQFQQKNNQNNHELNQYKNQVNNDSKTLNRSQNNNSNSQNSKLNQTLSQQSQYENKQILKINDIQPQNFNIQDNKSKDLLKNLTKEASLKIKMYKNNSILNNIKYNNPQNAFQNNFQDEINQKATLDDTVSQIPSSNNINNLFQRANYSLGQNSISDIQQNCQKGSTKYNKGFDHQLKRDILAQEFSQKNNSQRLTDQKQIIQQSISETNGDIQSLQKYSCTNGTTQELQLSKEFSKSSEKKYDFTSQKNSINIEENTISHKLNNNESNQIKNNHSNFNNSNINSIMPSQILTHSRSKRSTSCAKQQRIMNIQNNIINNQTQFNLQNILTFK